MPEKFWEMSHGANDWSTVVVKEREMDWLSRSVAVMVMSAVPGPVGLRRRLPSGVMEAEQMAGLALEAEKKR
jgi:hypothetical protein